MKRKGFLRKLATSIVVAGVMFSSISVFAAPLPESITMNGKVFVMDKTVGDGSGTATPDNSMSARKSSYVIQRSYEVLGSDVGLYVDYSQGHGGDHFALGWVLATAPRFTARAEVWSGNRLETSGKNFLNKGDTADAWSYEGCGLVTNARARIFYNW